MDLDQYLERMNTNTEVIWIQTGVFNKLFLILNKILKLKLHNFYFKVIFIPIRKTIIIFSPHLFSFIFFWLFRIIPNYSVFSIYCLLRTFGSSLARQYFRNRYLSKYFSLMLKAARPAFVLDFLVKSRNVAGLPF